MKCAAKPSTLKAPDFRCVIVTLSNPQRTVFKPTETDRRYTTVYNMKPTRRAQRIDLQYFKPTALDVISPQRCLLKYLKSTVHAFS